MLFELYQQSSWLEYLEDPNELNAVDRSIGLRRLSNGKLEKCSVEPRSTNQQQQEKTPPPTITTSSLIHDASISKQSLVQERSVFDTLQEQVGDVKCPQINCNFEFGPCGYRNIADSKWIVVRGEYGPELFSRITKAAKG